MQRTLRRFRIPFVLLALGLLFTMWSDGKDFSRAQADESPSADALPQPVDDMHHFMEYIFEPNYERLREQLAEEPADKQSWKAIRGDALTLAECANLLLLRAPKENADWQRLSAAVRAHGGELYQAARLGDYTASREAYTTMLTQCNACHTQFAGGEYQLEP